MATVRVLDGYVRVSRVGKRGGESFISPEVQREAIERWAAHHGAEIGVMHVDLDQSGGKLNRPAFNEAVRRVEAGLTGGIVVAKLDRFARSLPGALEALRRLDEAGAEFVSVQEGVDPRTPAGKLMHQLLLALAEFELDRIRESWEVARKRAVERGVHFRVPVGYRKGEGGRLEIGDGAAAVRLLFALRAQGAGWAEIAERLNREHPREIEWLPSVLPRMVRNRAYLGEAFHGEHRHDSAHDPLVDVETFEAAQSARAPARSGSGSLLGGMVRCASCRYPMRASRGGRKTPVYRCQVRHALGRCPAPVTVTQRLVDEYVEREFLARFGDLEVVGTEASDQIAGARERVAVCERELDAFASDLRLREALGHERFVSAVEQRAEELRQAQAELEEARRVAVGILVPDGALWAGLTTAERRALIAEGVDCVFLRRTGHAPISERTLILWRGEAPDDLPGRGRSLPIRSFEW